jgi:serine/threonine-protein kinase HipA
MRNHGLVYAENGQWKLSPLYDVVPFPQSTNTWALALHISSQGRMATVENALAAAPAFGVRVKDANFIIEQIRDKVKNWRNHYAACGLTDFDIQKISSCFHITDL